MSERKFNAIFKGEIHEQATLSLVQERLASVFKVDVEKIKIMFSKNRTIVKKNVSWEMCQKVEQGFLNAGAYIDIEEVFPEGYVPEVAATGPPPGYVPNQEPVYSPESEQGYASEPESEEGYAQEPEYAPDPGYAAEPEPEYEPEVEYESSPEPEIMNLEPEGTMEPAKPESISQPPLSMENEINESTEVVPEPEDYEDETTSGFAPVPEYEPEVEDFSEDESLPEDDDLYEVEYLSESEEVYEPEIESEPEFEIIENEPDDELEPEPMSEFEIQGIDPEIESEPESESDPEYEFDDMDGFDTVESELKSLEMDEKEFLDEVSPENPYEAPRAKLTKEDDDFSSKSNFVYPQKLPAKNGINWLLGGFALFKHNPFAWIFSVFIFFLVTMAASLIPFLGAIATNLFNPVFLAGFMIGAKEQTEGGNYRIGHVFAGFSNNTGQLILFGLLYLIATLAIFGLMAIAGVVGFFAMSSGSMNFSDPAILSQLTNISPLILLLIFLVIMLITFPIIMAYYFGPALVSINQASVFNAAKMSFKACLCNMFPFLLYGLACMGILIIVGLIVGGITVLLGYLLDQTGIFIGIAFGLLVWIAIVPVGIASTYLAYKDIFYMK